MSQLNRERGDEGPKTPATQGRSQWHEDAARGVLERAVLERVLKGDREAAGELWGLFGGRMVAYAEGVLGRYGRREQGADVVQGVLCEVMKAGRVREIEDVGAYLARCVRNAAFNLVRGEGRRATHEAAAGNGGSSGGASFQEEAGRGEMHARLDAAVARLPEDLAEVVLLRHVAGLTLDQMALSLGVARQTLHSRYKRALELVRAELAEAAGARATGGGQ